MAMRFLIPVLSNSAMAAVFLITWLRPGTFGEYAVKYLLLVVVVEFVLIHSAPFMGVVIQSKLHRKWKVLGIAGFGVFYSLFAGALAVGFKDWLPLIAFWSLTLNRTISVFGPVPRKEDDPHKLHLALSWAMPGVYYIVAIFFVALVPLPRFGITAAVAASQRIPGEGEFVDNPHTAIAAGFLYFAALAWSYFVIGRWRPSRVAGRTHHEMQVATDRPVERDAAPSRTSGVPD
ncbi:MAG: hypothetical protein ACYTGN_10625 [Planctomycetota bacterium]|jgi:hypothetical protein